MLLVLIFIFFFVSTFFIMESSYKGGYEQLLVHFFAHQIAKRGFGITGVDKIKVNRTILKCSVKFPMLNETISLSYRRKNNMWVAVVHGVYYKHSIFSVHGFGNDDCDNVNEVIDRIHDLLKGIENA